MNEANSSQVYCVVSFKGGLHELCMGCICHRVPSIDVLYTDDHRG